jgi:hypothetical protein
VRHVQEKSQTGLAGLLQLFIWGRAPFYADHRKLLVERNKVLAQGRENYCGIEPQ